MKSIVHSVKSPAWRCPWAGCAFVLASLLVGCASPSVTLPPQTLLIAEVSHVLTAEQVAAGGRGPAGQDDTMSVWAAKLHTPDQIARGRVFVLRSAIYWNNTVSGIEREGWQRPRTYWHKLPGAVPANAAPGGTTSPGPAVDAPSVPRGATPAADAGEGLARLILRRNKGYEGAVSVFALPVSIDGQQVSALDEGYCDLVLLAPGRHVVQAGTAAMGDPSGLPPLTLELDVTGGSRIVAEYGVDAAKWRSLNASMSALLTSREVWGPDVFRFTQRPATPEDRCAIRYTPRIVGGTAPAAP